MFLENNNQINEPEENDITNKINPPADNNQTNANNLLDDNNPIVNNPIDKIDSVNKINHKIKKQVSFFKYNFIDLDDGDLELYNPNLKLFELKMLQKYSLGSDSFYIDHGKDYFAFFRRLGHVNYLIIQHDEEKIIIGTSCAILRKYSKDGTNNKITGSKSVTPKLVTAISFWYLCDLKIDIAHRGQDLTSKLLAHMAHKFITKCHRGYLISMDPGSKQIIHIFKNMDKIIPVGIPSNTLTKLLIYSVNKQVMTDLERFFKCAFGDVTYLSLDGIKDLILTSTNKTMKVYHLQHGRYASPNGILLDMMPEESMCMFCFPKNSPLEMILNNLNIKTDITATIMSWSMKFFDWHDILTSDI